MNNIQTLPNWIADFLRLLTGIGFAIAGGYVAFLLLFGGAITYTGCFITCVDANWLAGAALLGGGALVGAGAATFLVWAVANRRISLRVVFACSTAVLLVVAAMLVT